MPGSPAWAFRSENYKYPALPHPLFFCWSCEEVPTGGLTYLPYTFGALINIFSPPTTSRPTLQPPRPRLSLFFFRSTLTLSSFIGLRRSRLIARICKTRSLNSLSLILASRRFGAEEERSKPALFFFLLGRSASTSLRSGNNRTGTRSLRRRSLFLLIHGCNRSHRRRLLKRYKVLPVVVAHRVVCLVL